MEIIQTRKHHFEVDYFLDFTWIDDKHSGFHFQCDPQGNLLDKGKEAFLTECKTNPKLKYNGIEEVTRSWTDPKIGLCVCGQQVALGGMTNTCHGCGKDYNWNGTLLAPREQWGEETGEHPDDIARIP